MQRRRNSEVGSSGNPVPALKEELQATLLLAIEGIRTAGAILTTPGASGPGKAAGLELTLQAVPKTARALIAAALERLGPDWQATFFRSHIIVDKERRRYKQGETVAVR
jgi:hypothetical protein